jgi:hypothetical protein
MSLYERDDWTLFRSLETLGQQAGVPTSQLVAVVVKELVDNALDCGSTCKFGTLPDNGIFVEDDGDGIDGTDEAIAQLFSIARPLKSSKLLRTPTRGALGNGLRVVVGSVLATGGTLLVATRERTQKLDPQDNGTTISSRVGNYRGPGTRIEVRFGPALVATNDALIWAEQANALSRGESRYAGSTSPHWYNSDAFFELMQAAGERTVRDVIHGFDGCSGQKAGKIAANFRARMAIELSRDEADTLLTTARKLARPVQPKRLGQLGSTIEGLPSTYAKITGTYESKASRGQHHAVLPFVLEVYAEVAEAADFGVSVNRTPVAAVLGSYHEEDMQSLVGCGISPVFKVGRRPLRLWINVDSPYMPITTDGKAPDLSPLSRAIRSAVGKVIKRVKSQGRGGPKSNEPGVKGVILECLDAAIKKTSGDGQYRFSLRQLFYTVRPHVITVRKTEPEYNYFADIITEYEASHGEIVGMYRDPRGIIYHPHTGEEIQLGTIQVENYQRPRYTFNKVLYCEKEGLFPILKAAKWPERHDCALMTSKGFASRAARDLLDYLGDTDEELSVYCIHDADAAGTMIHQALQDETKARGKRNVEVKNLGLDPDEALEMELEVEEVKRKKGKKSLPVARYAKEAGWEQWLQKYRVELNAMTSPQLLEWLDSKFDFDPVQKVIPPGDILSERLEQDVRKRLERQVTEDVLREARLSQRVDAEFSAREEAMRKLFATLEYDVLCSLAENPAEHWTSPLGVMAELIVAGGVPGADAATSSD